MKRAIILFLLAASAAHGQALEAARHRLPARIVLGIGREFKQSFADMRHDPLWAIYVFGAITLNGLDAGTTVYGQRQGLVESNPILGRHPSTAKVVSLTSIFTAGELLATHKLRSEFTQACERDAADQSNKWHRINALSHNPDHCKYALDAAGLATFPMHITIIRGNFDSFR